MLAKILVVFYRLWHGKLHLKGSGVLVRFCARILPGFDRYLLDVPNLGQISVDLSDTSGTGWVNYCLNESGHEAGLILAISKLAPQNPVIWDVGANAGILIATLVHYLDEYREIRLFEPNPKLLPSLRSLGKLLPNVSIHDLAFSDKPGILTLYVPKKDSSTASLSFRARSTPIRVECTTGDIFLREKGATDPDVVIIDTEGNDCLVINGLSDLIRRKRPLFFFEHIFVSEADILANLPDGYRNFTIDDVSGELLAGLNRDRGHNSVFVPSA